MTSPSTPNVGESGAEAGTGPIDKATRLERIKQRTIEMGLYTEYWDSPETDPSNGREPAA